jgi:hypothetical protein
VRNTVKESRDLLVLLVISLGAAPHFYRCKNHGGPSSRSTRNVKFTLPFLRQVHTPSLAALVTLAAARPWPASHQVLMRTCSARSYASCSLIAALKCDSRVRHFGRVFTFAVERAAGEIVLGSADGSSAHPALVRPCAFQRRPFTLSIGLFPASCVADDVVPVPFDGSRRRPLRLPALLLHLRTPLLLSCGRLWLWV